MRIHFTDRKRPKSVAKQVRDLLNAVREPALPPVTLAKAQAITARMFGYRDWHELDGLAGNFPASPYDEDCPPEVVRNRVDHQARAFRNEGVDPETAEAIVETLRPSSRCPGKARDDDGQNFHGEPMRLPIVTDEPPSPARGIWFFGPVKEQGEPLWVSRAPG